MGKYNSFEDMDVWKLAMELAEKIFRLTENLPRKEDYGLTSQIRRSSLSVSGNIAEGYGREHTRNKLNFYFNARGSLAETKSHLLYAQRVAYFENEDADELLKLISDIWRELNKLIKSLKSRLPINRSNKNEEIN